MARTPLLQSIVRLVREHQRADAQGIGVQALREREARQTEQRHAGLRRRDFVGTALLAAGAAAAPPPLRAHTHTRVAVVGAGIAGLSAALKLADNGIDCTVYEAGNRVGGRMFSNTSYFEQGQVFEWGGEFIDTGHRTMRRLARRFDLPLDNLLAAEPRGSKETYYFSGQYYPKAQADADFRSVLPIVKYDLSEAGPQTTVFESTPWGRMLNRMSLYDWIESRVPGGHASPLGALLDTAYYNEFSTDTREQSALNLVYLLGYQPNDTELSTFGESDEKYHVRGGNQRIPQAIARHLGYDKVRMGMRLQALARKPNGRYELLFSEGRVSTSVNADLVLLTTPFAVLRDLDTARAGFDARKNFAIQNLGAGRQSKLHLQFDRRVWNDRAGKPNRGNGSSYADTGYQSSWDATRAQPGSKGSLVGYAAGAFADARETRVAFSTATRDSVQRDAQRFLVQAEPVFDGLRAAWNGRATQSLPHLDPLMKLSYACFKVGQYETIAGYERVRQGNVFFAGEHCSFDFQGYMEGAATEGERAAVEMLATLEITKPR